MLCRARRNPLRHVTVYALGLALWAGAAMAATRPYAKSADAPSLPKPMPLPTTPISQGASVGFLPGASDVSPMGQFLYSIPLDVPEGRSGMQPSLQLRYASDAGNGMVGIGWSLAGLSRITRCGKSYSSEGRVDGVDFTSFFADSEAQRDRFCLDGSKLVAISGSYGASGAEYRTEHESYAQIHSYTDIRGADAPTRFVVRRANGVIQTYTAVYATRYRGKHFYPQYGGGETPFPVPLETVATHWLLSEESDRSGNRVDYFYSTEQGTIPAGAGPQTPFNPVALGVEYRLDRIEYTRFAQQGTTLPAKRKVSFEYEQRPDKGFRWASGVLYADRTRLKWITMHAPNPAATEPVWRYRIEYTQSPQSGRSLLSAVQKCGVHLEYANNGPTPGTPSVKPGACLWKKQFEWQTASVAQFTKVDVVAEDTKKLRAVDLDGDGQDDLLYQAQNGKAYVRVSRAPGHPYKLLGYKTAIDAGGLLPADQAYSSLLPVDLNRDGTSELFTITQKPGDPDLCRYEVIAWRSATQSFVTPAWYAPGEYRDCDDVSAQQHLFGDVDGDGLQDLVRVSDVDTVERNELGKFGPAQALDLKGSYRHMLDLDGDGRTEIVASQQLVDDPFTQWTRLNDSGAWESITDNYYGSRALPPIDDDETVFGDINGDGLQEQVHLYLDGCKPWTHWNTGNGELRAVGTVFDNNHVCADEMHVADIDLDGRDDLIVFDKESGTPNSLRLLRSRGNGDFDESKIAGHTPADFDSTALGDFNGDGLLDFSGKEAPPDRPSTTLVLMLQKPSMSDRIKAVRDEATAWTQEDVVWSRTWSDKSEARETCAYPLHCIKRGLIVVRELHRRQHLLDPVNPVLEARALLYSYEDPVVDLRGRGMRGFRKVRIWDPARPMERVTTYEPHKFVLGNAYPFAMRPSKVTVVTPLDPVSVGVSSAIKVRVVERLQSSQLQPLNAGKTWDDRLFQWSVAEWEQTAKIDWGAINALDNPTSERIYTVTPGTLLRKRQGLVFYDAFGNVTTRNVQTVNGAYAEETSTYDNLTADWLIGLRRTRAVRQDEPANPDQPSVTRRTNFEYDTKGRLWTVSLEPTNADLSLRLRSELAYDSYGSVSKLVQSAYENGQPVTRELRFEHEPMWPGQPDERLFTSQVWQPFVNPSHRPSTWYAHHPAHGVLQAVMDVNGVAKSAEYDDLGRPLSLHDPGAQDTSFSYTARSDSYGGISGLITTTKLGSTDNESHTDALGRTVRERQKTFNGSFASTDYDYDIVGNLIRWSEPFQGQVASAWTTTSFDPLGRVRSVTAPDGAKSSYSHTFDSSTTIDALSSQHVSRRDLDGRVVKTETLLDGAWVQTWFRRAPFGLIDRVTDSKGNPRKLSYDVLGRVSMSVDPNKGTWTSTYNGFGEVVGQHHLGSNEHTEFDYDALGRIERITNPDGITQHVWDIAANGIGKLAQSTSTDGAISQFTYDGYGREQGESLTLGGVSYAILYGYDPKGRLNTVTYPTIGSTGLTAQYQYNGVDQVREVGFTTPGGAYATLQTIVTRDLRNRPLISTLGVNLHETFAYDAERAWLEQHTLTNAMNTKLFDLSYGYWANGLVASRKEAVIGRNESFEFDALNRLEDWQLVHQGTVRKTHYQYDVLGNLTDVFVDSVLSEHSDYGAGGALPNAVTGFTDSAGSVSISHDTHGRQTKFGTRNILAYSAFDLPRAMQMNGSAVAIKYDAFGQRVEKISGAQRTVYLAGLYEARSEGPATTAVFHIAGPDGQIADIVQAPGAGTSIQYLVNDALGSTALVLDAGGGVMQRLQFDPFGRRVVAGGQPMTAAPGAFRRGFTGHDHDDELGLINMRGRVYDPRLKRFLTPDPLVSRPLFGQTWNSYSYVDNSPLNFIDPTGLTTTNCDIWDTGFSCTTVDAPGPGGVPTTPGDWSSLSTSISIAGGTSSGWDPGWGSGAEGAAYGQSTGFGYGESGPAGRQLERLDRDGTVYESTTAGPGNLFGTPPDSDVACFTCKSPSRPATFSTEPIADKGILDYLDFGAALIMRHLVEAVYEIPYAIGCSVGCGDANAPTSASSPTTNSQTSLGALGNAVGGALILVTPFKGGGAAKQAGRVASNQLAKWAKTSRIAWIRGRLTQLGRRLNLVQEARSGVCSSCVYHMGPFVDSNKNAVTPLMNEMSRLSAEEHAIKIEMGELATELGKLLE